jgi:hypothetical protein
MSVDTLEYAKELESAGVTPEQAEAHARALKKAVDGGLATKADLETLGHRLEAALWRHSFGTVVATVGLVLGLGGLLLRLVR